VTVQPNSASATDGRLASGAPGRCAPSVHGPLRFSASAPASQWVFNFYTRHGSRTPFGGRHPSSRRSPLSNRGMRLGNRHRYPRSSRHIAYGKRLAASRLHNHPVPVPANSDHNLAPHRLHFDRGNALLDSFSRYVLRLTLET